MVLRIKGDQNMKKKQEIKIADAPTVDRCNYLRSSELNERRQNELLALLIDYQTIKVHCFGYFAIRNH